MDRETKPQEKLLEAVTQFEATLRQSASLGNQNFKENRSQAVKLRLLMAHHLTAISSLGDQAFDGDTRHGPFRSEFAKMRSHMALHHASWPIVAIDLEDPAYLASVKDLRKSNERFIGWVKQALSAGR